MSAKRFYAIHEAGHVLALWALGCTFRYSTLKTFKEYAGYTWIGAPMTTTDFCLVSLGGLAATILTGEDQDLCFDAARGDLEAIASQMIMRSEISDISCDLLDSVALCLTDNWQALEALTRHLLRKNLLAKEAEQILLKHKVPRRYPDKPFRTPSAPKNQS